MLWLEREHSPLRQLGATALKRRDIHMRSTNAGAPSYQEGIASTAFMMGLDRQSTASLTSNPHCLPNQRVDAVARKVLYHIINPDALGQEALRWLIRTNVAKSGACCSNSGD
jgi:hypothetical protein